MTDQDDQNLDSPSVVEGAKPADPSHSTEKELEDLRKYIAQAEENLEAAKKALLDITGEDISSFQSQGGQLPPNLKVSGDGKIIEGIFNGENMIGPEGKIFPVPANYASKSKLIEGDRLKLSVAEDGSFIFKQIGPAPRKNLVGNLTFEDNIYHVTAEGKRYNLLYASVTYHKAKPGDKVTITVPADGNSTWAALENIIHDVASTVTPEPESDIFGSPKQAGPTAAPPVPPPFPPPYPDQTVQSAGPTANIQPQPPALSEESSSEVKPETNSLGEALGPNGEPGTAVDLEI